MAITGLGDDPFKSAWFTNPDGSGNFTLLYQSPSWDAAVSVSFGDFFFEAGAHALTASSVAAGTPAVGAPTIGQTHALTAASVAAGAPTVGAASLGQIHGLAAASVAAGAPFVGTPTVAEAKCSATARP